MGAPSSFDSFFLLTVTTLARLYTMQPRRWGMRVTVINDGTATNNGDYVLSYNHADDDIDNNDNWVKVSDLGQEWQTGGDFTQFDKNQFNYGGNPKLSFLAPYAGYGSAVGTSYGQTVVQASDIPNNSCVLVKAHISGIKSDGTEGYSGEVVASFRKDSAGTLTIIGASTNPVLNEDVTASVTAVLSASAGGVILTVTMGGASGNFTQVAWIEMTLTSI